MFEPEKLRFNYIDLLSSPRRALRGKKIWTMLIGLVVGYLVYLVLTYLALLIDGMPPAAVWNRWGLYPLFAVNAEVLTGVLPWLVYSLGLLIWLVSILFAATVVSRITYKELKGDLFYSIRDGWAFTRRHWKAVVFSPVAIATIILFFLILAAVMALVGKIPYLGELIFVGLYPFYFIGAIFTLYSGAVLMVLLLYLPTIVSMWEENAMGSSFQAYTITWNQPWRIVVYASLVAVLAIVSAWLYGWIITAGYQLINTIFGAPGLMGSKLDRILAWAEELTFSGYARWFCYIPGQGTVLSPLSTSLHPVDLNVWETVIGTLLAVSMFMIYGSVLAYGLTVITVGQSLSYLIYKMKTEDENLLERWDEEDQPEEVEEKPEADAKPQDTSAGDEAGNI